MSKIFRHKTGFFTDDKTVIMGILNITPDSFYDGGKYLSYEKALEYAKRMVDDGADIIDIGAMSTRPGSKIITPKEEIKRLSSVFDEISKLSVVSVDTVYPETAEFALENGASIVNDVSGIFNEKMAKIVKKYKAGWILAHTMGVNAGADMEYPDGVEKSVIDFFDNTIKKCKKFGIENEYICLDPGFGFAKNTEQNVLLLNNKNILSYDASFILSALSRKRFTGNIMQNENNDRLTGTLIADVIAMMNGANMIRVHDVKEAKQSLKFLGE